MMDIKKLSERVRKGALPGASLEAQIQRYYALATNAPDSAEHRDAEHQLDRKHPGWREIKLAGEIAEE